MILLRGFAKGMLTKWLTDEMDLAYPTVLDQRHRIQAAILEGERVGLPGETPEDRLPDPVVEADEMYQNAGEKGDPHRDPDDPPRQRANMQRGRGTYENDQPPIAGMVGRETGWVSLKVCTDTKKETLQAVVTKGTAKEATVFTDENRSYLWLESEEESRDQKAINHSKGWAGDADGIREVHVNTIEASRRAYGTD